LRFQESRPALSTTAGAGIALVVIILVGLAVFLGTTPGKGTPSTFSISQRSIATLSPTISTSTTPTNAKLNVDITAGSSTNQTSSGYSPATMTVNVGDAVTWTNDDNAVHTVTADKGGFYSGDLKPGQSFSFVFLTAGNYTYHCNYHGWMKGTIVVQKHA